MEEGREKGRCKSPQRGVAASCGFSTLNPYREMRINQKKPPHYFRNAEAQMGNVLLSHHKGQYHRRWRA